jgi:2-oxo-4-hydroxy-4-carboxy--5-ureidoimidazoline (OHCU) decarboxylase
MHETVLILKEKQGLRSIVLYCSCGAISGEWQEREERQPARSRRSSFPSPSTRATMSASTASLPPLSAIVADTDPISESSPLTAALSLLFEPSPVLTGAVAPAVHAALHAPSAAPLLSYSALVARALAAVRALPTAERAAFIAAHPRIGAPHSTLSALSAAEQAAHATPAAVLARLAHLNACYERVFPGLVFVTFVAGRPRAAVAEEMEDALALPHGLAPDAPPLDALAPVRVEGAEWMAELDILDRAVEDVGRIALARLRALGAE